MRETDRRADRQTGRQAGRQTNRQTDRQTEKDGKRARERDSGRREYEPLQTTSGWERASCADVTRVCICRTI